MASNLKNLSDHDPASIPDGSKLKIGIVVSEWNEEITASLLQGALDSLQEHGVSRDRIRVLTVPGSFELTYGARLVAEEFDPNAVICIGCVIQGETPHFDYVSKEVSRGISAVNLEIGVPVIFGILTTNTLEEAVERSGVKRGNKGFESGLACLELVNLLSSL